MLKSGDHKHELAEDMTHETDKLSVGLNFDNSFNTNYWIDLYWTLTAKPVCTEHVWPHKWSVPYSLGNLRFQDYASLNIN